MMLVHLDGRAIRGLRDLHALPHLVTLLSKFLVFVCIAVGELDLEALQPRRRLVCRHDRSAGLQMLVGTEEEEKDSVARGEALKNTVGVATYLTLSNCLYHVSLCKVPGRRWSVEESISGFSKSDDIYGHHEVILEFKKISDIEPQKVSGVWSDGEIERMEDKREGEKSSPQIRHFLIKQKCTASIK